MPCDCLAHHRATTLQFDTRKARDELAAYHRDGPGLTTRQMLAGLRAIPVTGTLLDIGTGMGALTFELLAAGMSSAACVDIAPGSLAVAREEAGRRQLTSRISWHQGDFVDLAGALPAADVVTLDKVVCCYPEYRQLLGQAAAHGRRWLAMSFPRDRWYVRSAIWLENFWRRLRGNAFRAFVHPVAAMDTLLRDAGFEAVNQTTSFVWQTNVYARKAG